jgi:hypothetical protein
MKNKGMNKTLSIETQLNEYLLTINIAVRQNPRWVLGVHELLGDVAD